MHKDSVPFTVFFLLKTLSVDPDPDLSLGSLVPYQLT